MYLWYGALRALNDDIDLWSSTVYLDNVKAYVKRVASNKIYIDNSDSRAYAFSVRCLAL